MGRKTSVYLSDEQIERWHQSGLSLSELVSRGLDVGDGLALEVGRSVLDVLRRDVARTAVMVHTAPDTALPGTVEVPHDVPHTAADTVTAEPAAATTAARKTEAPRRAEPRAPAEPKREKCNHPKARVLKGQCRVCFEYVGKSA